MRMSLLVIILLLLMIIISSSAANNASSIIALQAQHPKVVNFYSPYLSLNYLDTSETLNYRITYMHVNNSNFTLYNSDFGFPNSTHYTTFPYGREFSIGRGTVNYPPLPNGAPIASRYIIKMTPILNPATNASFMTDLKLGKKSITLPYGPHDPHTHSFFIIPGNIPFGKYVIDVYAYYPNYNIINVHTTKIAIGKVSTH